MAIANSPRGCATNCWTGPGSNARRLSIRSNHCRPRSRAPRRCRRLRPAAVQSSCSIVPIIVLRAGQWTRLRSWPGTPRQGLEDVARIRDLRPRRGAAGDRRRHRRRGNLVNRRQDRNAGDPRRESPSLTVSGTVKTISNGRYRNRGPMARGVQLDMGPAVVLDTGAVEIVLILRRRALRFELFLGARHRSGCKNAI